MAKDPAQKANRKILPTNLDATPDADSHAPNGQGQGDLPADKNQASVHDISQASKNKARLLKPAPNKSDIQARIKQAETPQSPLDQTRKEVEIVERELKIYTLQQEVEQLRPLSGLYRVIKAVATEQGLEPLLEVIANESKSMLKCDRLSVYILESRRGELWTKLAQGDGQYHVLKVPLASTSVISVCARTGKIINIADAYADSRFDSEEDKQAGYFTRNLLCVPLFNRNNEVVGVFEALNKTGGPFTEEDGEWLKGLAAVAGGLIEQAQSYAEIESFMDKTLEMLAQTIDKRDPLTAGHSMRVTNYSLLIAEALNLGHADLDVLRYSAMMHDYGKIGVPEAILWKNGRLTPDEYACVQTHARLTFDLLSTLPFTKRLAAVPFVASCHHEKLDGSGYYRGLRGQEIPFLARVITVADVFDALTSVRHYRNRMAITKVTEIMEDGRGNHFDPAFIDIFYRLPCDLVLKVMESERGQNIPAELELFSQISLQRLIELCSGAKPTIAEEGLKETFERIYNAGLPADYQALD
jgi:HD-GYP domain-containing protein (c-di-GMP phosphodiesterase class II)